MADVNTVTIDLVKYDHLKRCEFEAEEAHNQVANMVDYLDRVEKVIFDYIKKETEYGEYTYLLKDKFADIISVLNAHEVDWSEGKPQEEGEDGDS